jgi:hypothetical protein
VTLSVAIPDTSLSDCSDLREKTVKLGSMARAFAVFRVEEVLIYETGNLEPKDQRDAGLIAKILRFMDTPQYLRRRVFSKSASLRYAGLLPPLRTRSHPLRSDDSALEGSVRWGVQTHPGKVDIGLERLVPFKSSVSKREPTLFKITRISPRIEMEIIDRSDLEIYWGFETHRSGRLSAILKEYGDFTRVGFSRRAPSFSMIEEDLTATVTNTGSILAVFGDPAMGILDIYADERNLIKSKIDFWVNSISNQGTETVRLEEALFVSLGLLNHSLGLTISKTGYYT